VEEEKVILVSEKDEPIGIMNKLEAHQKGLLHRAFSVFLFNSKGELLLQQRSLFKYHSPGLWSNTCCSHPRPGENSLHAASRRLKEEMSIEAHLVPKTIFTYYSKFDNGLIEHEVDHVFTGIYDKDPIINPEEVNDFSWKSMSDIHEEIKAHPEKFTSWFKIALERIFV
jgi:isopentenyl-diphosphate delta-isomerase